jgi:O-antigen/teichoic acid export membrane protein
MIGAFLELDFVGIFTVTSFIALIIDIPLVSLEKISNVQIAKFWVENNLEGIKSIYKKSVKYLMLIGGLLLIGILLNIEDMLSFLPQEYANAKNVTVIASIGAFINISTGLNNAVLFNSNKYVYGTYLLLLLLVLAIINNLIFIPLWGIEGAAFASAFSVVIYNMIKFLIIKIKFKMQPYDLNALKILLIISITFIIGYVLPSFDFTIFSMIFRSVIVSIIYVSLVYLFRIVPEFDKYFKLKF